jgi:OFA family oxalate/formate antiporter-like MFS transporter
MTEKERPRARWWQLALGVACMAMVANLQYGWTLFVDPIQKRHGWPASRIQAAFTLFVLFETWLVPFEGYLVDRFGPRAVAMTGGALCAVAWAVDSVADSLGVLYVAAALGGIGAGAVYGTCVGNALKWFGDRRGLAAGLTAAGFGAGSALTVIPIRYMIVAHGYETAFLVIGLLQGGVVVILAWWLRRPRGESSPRPSDAPSDAKVDANVDARQRQFTPVQMVRTPVFWVLYAMFASMAAGGLIAVAQLAPIAKDYRVADVPIAVFGASLPAVSLALSLDRLLNGITRPFFGWLSDRIGREHAMGIAFTLQGAAVVLLGRFGADPVSFVVLSGLVFFSWGEIYSLFPAICGDTYGVKFAAANAGALYTAKGFGALFVPLAGTLAQRSGFGWQAVFAAIGVTSFSCALLALLVVKPLRARMAAVAGSGGLVAGGRS